VDSLAEENERLKAAIRRLAEQDATLSVCDGNVTVQMDDIATLRDQFAAAALTGLLAGFQNGKSCDSYAAEAYEVADAMLRARQPTE